MPKAPRDLVGVRIDESPCDHGVSRGNVNACIQCLGGHLQDCAVFSMEYGKPKPGPCNCGRMPDGT